MCRERKLHYHDVSIAGMGPFLGQAHAGHPRLAEYGLGHHLVIRYRQCLYAGNRFGSDHALSFGGVRELQLAGDVTDRRNRSILVSMRSSTATATAPRLVICAPSSSRSNPSLRARR